MTFLLTSAVRCAGGPSLSQVVVEFVIGDHARLVDSMRLAKELAASSNLFAKLSELCVRRRVP
jgi:hypothetical protein